mmetsp:Transcript_114577/g.228007  ORF Transcript_114577/g.228007 Transcript_114577/m.228007 type:complete len:89 (-) Transcript_114577:330-596(-)
MRQLHLLHAFVHPDYASTQCVTLTCCRQATGVQQMPTCDLSARLEPKRQSGTDTCSINTRSAPLMTADIHRRHAPDNFCSTNLPDKHA